MRKIAEMLARFITPVLIYNLLMVAGFVSVAAGVFMYFGTPIGLMVSGGLMMALTFITSLPARRAP